MSGSARNLGDFEQVSVDPSADDIVTTFAKITKPKHAVTKMRNGRAWTQLAIDPNHEPEGKRLLEDKATFAEIRNLLASGAGQFQDSNYSFVLNLWDDLTIPRKNYLLSLDMDELNGDLNNGTLRQRVNDTGHILRMRFDVDCKGLRERPLEPIWAHISTPDVSLKNKMDPTGEITAKRIEIEGERRHIDQNYLRPYFQDAITRFSKLRGKDLPFGLKNIKSANTRVRSAYLCSRASYFAVLTVLQQGSPANDYKVIYEVTNDDTVFMDPLLTITGQDHELEFEAKALFIKNDINCTHQPHDIENLLANGEEGFAKLLSNMQIHGRHSPNKFSKVERGQRLVNQAWRLEGDFLKATTRSAQKPEQQNYIYQHNGSLNALSRNLTPVKVLERFGAKLVLNSRNLTPPTQILGQLVSAAPNFLRNTL